MRRSGVRCLGNRLDNGDVEFVSRGLVRRVGGSSAAGSNAAPGTVRTDANGVEQVWVPAGTFTIGSDDATLTPPPFAKDEAAAERPAHEVSISNGFWIDRTEVTNAAFKAFVDAGGYTNQGLWSDKGLTWLKLQNPASLPRPCESEAADQPRACINWFEAEAYAKWRGGSLPTEAQWEYAARGPESRVYPWGDTWDPAEGQRRRCDRLEAGRELPRRCVMGRCPRYVGERHGMGD